MKFLAITLIVRAPDPVTGVRTPATEHRASPELLQSEIAPVLRREIPSRPFPAAPAGR